MGFGKQLYRNGRVLRIVLGNIQLELIGNLLGIDSCINSRFTLVQHSQYGFVHIIVYQNNALCGRLNDGVYKSVGVVDLTVIEYALFGF